MKARVALVCLWLVASAIPARAAEAVYRIVPGDSEIRFVLTSTLNDIEGVSTQLTGEITFDRARPDRSSIVAEIPFETIKTGIDRRDRHMYSEDFIDTAHFPAARFISSSIEVQGDAPEPGAPMQVVYKGSFEVHGERVPIEGVATAKLSEDGRRIEGEARFPVNLPAHKIPVPAFMGIWDYDEDAAVTVRIIGTRD